MRRVSARFNGPGKLALGLGAAGADRGGGHRAGRGGSLLFVVADTVKEGSAEAVASLAARGLRPVLLTGDNEAIARGVAEEVGIQEAIAEVLPADEPTSSAAFRRRAVSWRWSATASTTPPRLAQADLGLSIGTGTDVTIETSELTLVSGVVRAAADASRLSRSTLRTIRPNVGWAFGYNVAAIPLAAHGPPKPGHRQRRDGDLKHVVVAKRSSAVVLCAAAQRSGGGAHPAGQDRLDPGALHPSLTLDFGRARLRYSRACDQSRTSVNRASRRRTGARGRARRPSARRV